MQHVASRCSLVRHVLQQTALHGLPAAQVDLAALLEHPKSGGETAPVPETLAAVPADNEDTFALDAI